MKEREFMPLSASRQFPEVLPQEDFSLWRDAPAWRNLTLAAVGFTVALALLPFTKTADRAGAPDQTEQIIACHGNPAGFAGRSGSGRVVGFLTIEQASRLLQNTQFTSRMAINPDYLANVRSLVHLDGDQDGSRSVYLVPSGLTVKMGDHVQLAGGHVDLGLPCHYIPNLITKLDSQN
ncbi:MAG: hypothetical protein K2W78_00615 [Xanthobacteraceae bacterium]|nr:hypothetical protein [Xanthobacteraceae bacterium]